MGVHIITLTRGDWDTNLRFRVLLPQGAKFRKGQGVCLSGLQIYNSFKNISSSLNNQIVQIRHYAYYTKNPDTGATLGTPELYWDHTWVIYDGFYSASSLSAWFQYKFYSLGIYATNNTTGVIRYPNSVRYAIQINLSTFENLGSAYTISPTSPCAFFTGQASPQTPTITLSTGLAQLLGYVAGSYGGAAADQALLGTVAPQISPTSGLHITCNLVQNPYNVITTHLHTMPLTEAYGGLCTFSQPPLTFSPIVPNHYQYVEVQLLDSVTGAIQDIYDKDCTITLSVSEAPQEEEKPHRLV